MPVSTEYPSTSPEEQVNFMQDRGMTINDKLLAVRSLRFISYYRLRAYWLAFENPPGKYMPGTTFEHGLNLYFFDRELRLLVLDAIERVEVALRARWEQRMSKAHGHYGYFDDASLYRSEQKLGDSKDLLKDDYDNYKKDLKEHYQIKYKELDPNRPVVWMAAERMSFGNLVGWISNLKHGKGGKDRQAIARELLLNERELDSLIFHLKDVRNICAHHDRLWDREIESIRVSMVLTKPANSMNGGDGEKLHNTLVLLFHLLNTIEPEGAKRWREQVKALIARCQSSGMAGSSAPSEKWLGASASLSKNWVPVRMGFPEDWHTRPIWSA